MRGRQGQGERTKYLVSSIDVGICALYTRAKPPPGPKCLRDLSSEWVKVLQTGHSLLGVSQVQSIELATHSTIIHFTFGHNFRVPFRLCCTIRVP